MSKRRGVLSRFIPAGAGNTLLSPADWPAYSVYPRWRGEHKQLRSLSGRFAGLSPLARGTRGGKAWMYEEARFIPAGAGNTSFGFWVINYTPVYPRWRGEHANKEDVGRYFGGLSPLARGTRPRRASRSSAQRFIPAGAGNTKRFQVIHNQCAVYPRWRGEHEGKN